MVNKMKQNFQLHVYSRAQFITQNKKLINKKRIVSFTHNIMYVLNHKLENYFIKQTTYFTKQNVLAWTNYYEMNEKDCYSTQMHIYSLTYPP